MIRFLTLLSVLLASPARAAVLTFDFSDSQAGTTIGAELRLDSWLRSEPEVKDAVRRAAARAADGGEVLRDALAPAVLPIQAGLFARPRAAALQERPGSRPEAFDACRTIEECRVPPMFVYVEDASYIPEAMRALLRPWLLLQRARGRALDVRPAPDQEGRVLNVSVRGLIQPSVGLHVTPLHNGRFHVWLNGRAELPEIFAEARDAALAASGR